MSSPFTRKSAGGPTRVDVPVDQGMRRHVGRIGLLFTGVGSIIGSGWLFAAMTAAQIAGPASILAWALGLLMILVIGIAYSELGAMFPVAGGVIRFPQFSFGSFASYSSGWITWLAIAAVPPIEVLATIQYSSTYIPNVMVQRDGVAVLTGPGIVLALVLMLGYTVINIVGIRAFARFNNVLVWWKVFVILLVVVAFLLTAFHLDHFTSPKFGGFAPYGFDSVFTALASGGIAFTLTGFRQGVEFAAETDNPKKNVPIAVVGAIVGCGIVFIGLQIAFMGAVPDSALTHGWKNLTFANDFGPLAGLAGVIGLTWLAITLYADAIVSPLDTGLIYAGAAARLSYSQGRNGNAPFALTKLNKKGAPWVSILLMFVIGCIFFLPFPSWQKLAGFITSATILSFGTGPLVVAALRRQLPDQERPFRLKGGDVLPFLAFLSSNLIVYWAGWATNWRLFLAVVLGYIVLAIHYATAKDKSKIPPLQFKSGWWILVWFGGLALCSWLGHYGGGLDILGFGSGIVAMVVLTAVVYVLAMRTRLGARQVVENVHRQ